MASAPNTPSTRRSTPVPRPLQVQALSDLVASFAVHDRVQLVMACGTGKTLVARWHAQASEACTVLVLVPSLALLAQTLTEWRRDRSWPFEALVVCSDPSTPAGVAERESVEDEHPDWSSVRARATTDARTAARFLSRASSDRPRVLFSTYHSAPVVAAAQASSRTTFDLVVCDEAHRLAGSPREAFLAALDDAQIPARRRLFMTATPRYTTAAASYSMSDPEVFGPVAHTISFGDAIAAGVLTDYQVAVVGVEGEDTLDDASTVPPAALLDAVDRLGARRVLTFHGRVAKAAAFAAALDAVVTPTGKRVRARHVSGATRGRARDAALAWLGEGTADGEVRVMANARVLGEGVDVPAVDAVCFADPRSSVVDVIQAVGRVLRPHPDKRIGTVIVPVGLPRGGDDDTNLLLSRFSVLWSVLRALRAHDQRFADELDAQARATSSSTRRRHVDHGRISYLLPDWSSPSALHLRVVRELGDGWERHYGLLDRWAQDNPGRRLPRMERYDGVAIGPWAHQQREARRQGLLPVERVELLEQIPGWYWNRADAGWDDTYARLLEHVAAHGTIAENPVAPSVFTGQRAATAEGDQLGVWIAQQRQAHRRAVLEAPRVDLLEQLPGWTWTPVPAEDLAHVDALAQFCEFEKHAQVPDEHVEDGLRLGRWVAQVRRQKYVGTLHPALEDEIWAATPSRWRLGSGVRWQWEKPETGWRIGYDALRQYAQREGTATPPAPHVEQLADTEVRLGAWVSLQRHLRNKGELDAARATRLEQVPGWVWRGDVGGTRPPEPPLDLPPHVPHATPGALARGCKCAACREFSRAQQSKYARQRRERELVGAVSAAAARRNLERLGTQLTEHFETNRGRNVGRSLIAAASGVPLGVVRAVLDGSAPLVSREHAARLQAVTLSVCLSHVSASGTRGRLRQAGTERVPAGPVNALLDDLAARGFDRGWVGRELGRAGSIAILGRTCTTATATAVHRLHATLSGLDINDRPRTARPTLAQLRAERAAAA